MATHQSHQAQEFHPRNGGLVFFTPWGTPTRVTGRINQSDTRNSRELFYDDCFCCNEKKKKSVGNVGSWVNINTFFFSLRGKYR